MDKKPLELLVLSGMFVLTGTLGLLDIFFVSEPPKDILIIALVFVYAFIQPLIAYGLWSIFTPALWAARVTAISMLIFSFFLYGVLNQIILVANTLLYLYCLLYLFRYDIKVVYGED